MGMDKEALLECADVIRERFLPHDEENRQLMKKGLSLYRQGLVYNVVQNGDLVEGKVQDFTKVYDVTLDLDMIELSLCDCYQYGFCVHQLALFLSAYSSVEPVGDFLDSWKNGNQAAPVEIIQSPTPSEQSLTDWHAFFEERYQAFKRQRGVSDVYFASHLYHRYFGLLKSDAPKERELRRFYVIHAAITAFKKMAAEAPEYTSRTYFDLNSYVKTYMHQLIDVIDEELEPLKNTILPFAMDSLLEETLDMVRSVLLQHDSFSPERILLYEVFWSSANFPQKTLRDKEKEKLRELSGLGQIALSYHYFSEKEDEAALKLLTKQTPIPLEICFASMNRLVSKSEWERFAIWHHSIKDHVKQQIENLNNYQSRRDLVRRYLQLVEVYAYQTQKRDEYLTTIQSLLPYSFSEYSDYLFEVLDFKKWVELQLLLDPDLADYGSKMLKVVESHDRASLLPLYHHAVKKALDERNRKSYKLAVRYLKKLRTHYKKLKREPQFQVFLTRLVAENKRLRAFLEELRKGKLIDA